MGGAFTHRLGCLNPAAGGGGGGPVPTALYGATNRKGATAGGTLSVSGTNTGDVIFLFVETYNEAMPTPTADGTVTFTEVSNIPLSNGTSSTRLTIFEGTPCDATSPITVTHGDSGDHQIIRAVVFTGCERPGGSAVHKIGTTASSSSSSSVTLGGFTTTINNCLCLGVIAQHDLGTGEPTGWANSSLSSVATRSGITDGNGNNGGIGIGDGIMATAGAVGNFTATAGTSNWAGVQLAIR